MDPCGTPQHIFSGLEEMLNQLKMNRSMRRHFLLSIMYKLLHFNKSLHRRTAETEVYIHMSFLPASNWKGVLYLNDLCLSYFFNVGCPSEPCSCIDT